MPQHTRPNTDRLRMMMETNQVTAAQVAEILSVSEETVQGWLAQAREASPDVPEELLTQLRMKLAVTR